MGLDKTRGEYFALSRGLLPHQDQLRATSTISREGGEYLELKCPDNVCCLKTLNAISDQGIAKLELGNYKFDHYEYGIEGSLDLKFEGNNDKASVFSFSIDRCNAKIEYSDGIE